MGNNHNVRGNVHVHNSHSRNQRRYIHPAHGMQNELRAAIEATLAQIGATQQLIGVVAGAEQECQRLVEFEATFRKAIGQAKQYKFEAALQTARMARAHFQSLPDNITLMLDGVADTLHEFGLAQKRAVDSPPDDPKWQLTGVLLKIASEQEEAAQALGGSTEDDNPTVGQQAAGYLEASASFLRTASQLAREGKHEEASGIAGCGGAVQLMNSVAQLLDGNVPELFAKHLATVHKFWTNQLRASGYTVEDAYRAFPELRPASERKGRRNAERKGARRRGRKPARQARAS